MTVTPKPRSTDSDAGQGRRRKLRSSTVVLGSMGALAVALSGYSSEPDRRCVDPDSYDAVRGYRVLPPSQCETGGAGASARTAAFPAAGGAEGREDVWYYGGREAKGRAKGGTFIHAAAVERAGFGCDDDDDGSSGGGGYGG
ncbi:hypothetical protein ACH4RA_15605 [Streptomyces smyrnaeus]|uniref:hypothetical protein n=1 Tax=Streptomyces TaxID=1883 RepID=UPI000C1844F6|nr:MULTISPECIES: hypothetical protein [unclassified Streptomyces]MBQ0864904.1 hypothetical protein [Streptomyces sp. RK75]MBQ1122300.1 hypothetical protein [Streptomyces sp. B15]MBQ1159613.1 hypothetical protein [Streptomyces sp. A73]